ncbi:MAG: hypothetical protein AAB360_01000 [Patescibacteria group bacterium]
MTEQKRVVSAALAPSTPPALVRRDPSYGWEGEDEEDLWGGPGQHPLYHPTRRNHNVPAGQPAPHIETRP